jgi:positive regulator of sigma E activity
MTGRFGWLLIAVILTTGFGGTHWWTLPVGFVLVELGVIAAGRFSSRARARVDADLHALLRAAADKLPADRREAYLREWAGELHEIVRGPPVARVWPAYRYVLGIRRAAPAVAHALDPAAPPDRLRAVRDLAMTLALVPLVTPLLFLFVGLILAGMLLVALWAAALVTVRARRSFRRTFEAGCRRSELCLFGWPTPNDPQTRLSL